MRTNLQGGIPLGSKVSVFSRWSVIYIALLYKKLARWPAQIARVARYLILYYVHIIFVLIEINLIQIKFIEDSTNIYNVKLVSLNESAF